MNAKILVGLFLAVSGCTPGLPPIPAQAATNWCDVLGKTDLGQFECMRLPGQNGLGSWGPKNDINQNNISAIMAGAQGDLQVNERVTIVPAYNQKVTSAAGAGANFNLKQLSSWAPDVHLTSSGSSTTSIKIELKNLKIRSLGNLASTLMQRAWRVREKSDPSYFPIRQALYNLCRADQFIVSEILVGTPTISLNADSAFKLDIAAGWTSVGANANGGNGASAEWKLEPADGQVIVLGAHILNLHDALEQEGICTSPPPPGNRKRVSGIPVAADWLSLSEAQVPTVPVPRQARDGAPRRSARAWAPPARPGDRERPSQDSRSDVVEAEPTDGTHRTRPRPGEISPASDLLLPSWERDRLRAR
jgi:hypothetical protein